MRSTALLLCAGLLGCSDMDPPTADQGSDAPDLADAPDLTQAPDLADPLGPADRIHHLLCTGQSLSVGAAGAPALSTSQPFGNLMFNTGVAQSGGQNLTALTPLVEAGVETMESGLANGLTAYALSSLGKRPQHLVSCHGIGGTAYAGLKKGTAAYANGLAQVRAAVALAKAQGRPYTVRAITNVHGESDHVNANDHYADDLLTWQADYETDVRALTGQSDPVPMLHSQISSWTKYNSAQSPIPRLQSDASQRRPDRLILVGPKYFLPYADGVHLTNEGYRWMGEYYAKAYHRTVVEHQPFRPLQPQKATLSGATLRVTFDVPRPPLVLDTQAVKDPGRYGFEFTDGSAAPPTITQVALAGPDQVQLTLSQAPSGAAPRLRYAFTGVVGQPAGPTTGPRGNLRDSDDQFPSRHGKPLHNWCVHFDIAVSKQ